MQIFLKIVMLLPKFNLLKQLVGQQKAIFGIGKLKECKKKKVLLASCTLTQKMHCGKQMHSVTFMYTVI